MIILPRVGFLDVRKVEIGGGHTIHSQVLQIGFSDFDNTNYKSNMAIMWLPSAFWPDFEAVYKTVGRMFGKQGEKGRIAK